MKNCKRPRMKNQDRDFYETSKDFSEENIQHAYNFVRKVKELSDEKIFIRFVSVMRSYQSMSLSYVDAKAIVAFILRNHDFLLEEFYQLLLYLGTKEKNPSVVKSDLEKTSEFLNKVDPLGKDLHGASNVLKDEFKAFLIDFRLLKKPKQGLDAAGECRNLINNSGLLKPKHGLDTAEEYMNLTPSYSIRPEAAMKSSYSDEILNTKYVSEGQYDESRVKEKCLFLCERRMNEIDDKLLQEDMYLKALTCVVEFGNRVLCNEEPNEKPPVGFNEVVRRFYEDIGKSVPQSFHTDPKRAVQSILDSLQNEENKMNKTKELR